MTREKWLLPGVSSLHGLFVHVPPGILAEVVSRRFGTLNGTLTPVLRGYVDTRCHRVAVWRRSYGVSPSMPASTPIRSTTLRTLEGSNREVPLGRVTRPDPLASQTPTGSRQERSDQLAVPLGRFSASPLQ